MTTPNRQSETTSKEKIDCAHINAQYGGGHSSKDFYCPDCHLNMRIELNEGKKVGYKWYEIQ